MKRVIGTLLILFMLTMSKETQMADQKNNQTKKASVPAWANGKNRRTPGESRPAPYSPPSWGQAQGGGNNYGVGGATVSTLGLLSHPNATAATSTLGTSAVGSQNVRAGLVGTTFGANPNVRAGLMGATFGNPNVAAGALAAAGGRSMFGTKASEAVPAWMNNLFVNNGNDGNGNNTPDPGQIVVDGSAGTPRYGEDTRNLYQILNAPIPGALPPMDDGTGSTGGGGFGSSYGGNWRKRGGGGGYGGGYSNLPSWYLNLNSWNIK